MSASYAADGSAEPTAATATTAQTTAEQFLAKLNFQKGKITLPDGIATLNLPSGFEYLSPADADKVLVDAWGNPPGTKTLGMIVPANHDIISDTGWAVVVTYKEDGHIKDDDADSIKYDEILKDMQKATQEDNAAREKEGYKGMTLVGWAEPPRYDKQTHKIYWAKELATDGEVKHTLNYNIRVLGRKGVLVLNAVAGMDQIGMIKAEMPGVVAATEFNAGNTYSDFDSKTDHVAEYGLAALVAGGVAAKLGLFGKLLALLIAFKKVIIVGVLAFFGGIAKLFGRKKAE
jgi:uncharacterized membrane-anchored protein